MKKKNVTFSYALITAFFWMTFCIAIAYTADFLQDLGFQNTEIGLIMACGNVVGALMAPLLGGLCDRRRELTAFRLYLPLTLLKLACLAALVFSPGKDLFTAVAFGAYIAFSIPVNTLNLKICIDYERVGAKLDYGLARGCGSLGFVVVSALLGLAVERLGWVSLPAAGLIITVPETAMQLYTDRSIRLMRKSRAEQGTEPKLEKSSALLPFLRRNGRFTVFLLGSFLVFYAHNVDCNFVINLTRNVGGGTREMGLINSFTALVEIPVMMLYSLLFRRVKPDRLMRISLVLFVAKMLAYTFAPTVPMLFAARLLQAPSYALYTAATVPYVSMVIAEKDAARGQSLAFSVTTAGSVAASVIGGRMFDLYPVRTVMLIASCVCAVGALVAVLGVTGAPEDRQDPLQRI